MAGSPVVQKTQPVTQLHMRRRFLSRVEHEFKKTSDSFDLLQIDEWLSEGYLEAQLRGHLVRDQMVTTATADQFIMNLPDDMLDLIVPKDALAIKKSDGTWITYPDLKLIDYTTIRRKWPGLSLSDFGTDRDPRWWAIADTNLDVASAEAGQMVMVPPIRNTVASGLSFNYYIHPGVLRGVMESEDEGFTAAVVESSNTVTFGGVPSITPEVDWAFGVKSADTATPVKWYRVESYDPDTTPSTPTIDLVNVYAEASNPTAKFTLSDVSHLEWRRMGLLRFIAVDWAFYRWAQDEFGVDAQETERAYQLFEAKLMEAKQLKELNTDKEHFRGYSMHIHPAVRRSRSR